MWEESVDKFTPEYPARSQDLDVVFGITREATALDHRGALYEGIHYYSNGADDIRKICGAATKIDIKVNPLNMDRIWMMSPNGDGWVPADARMPDELRGLDLHAHRLLDKLTGRRRGRATLEEKARKLIRFEELLREAVTEPGSIQVASLAARAMGISTAPFFARLNHDGQLPSDQTAAPRTPDETARELHPERQRQVPRFDADHSLKRR